MQAIYHLPLNLNHIYNIYDCWYCAPESITVYVFMDVIIMNVL